MNELQQLKRGKGEGFPSKPKCFRVTPASIHPTNVWSSFHKTLGRPSSHQYWKVFANKKRRTTACCEIPIVWVFSLKHSHCQYPAQSISPKLLQLSLHQQSRTSRRAVDLFVASIALRSIDHHFREEVCLSYDFDSKSDIFMSSLAENQLAE